MLDAGKLASLTIGAVVFVTRFGGRLLMWAMEKQKVGGSRLAKAAIMALRAAATPRQMRGRPVTLCAAMASLRTAGAAAHATDARCWPAGTPGFSVFGKAHSVDTPCKRWSMQTTFAKAIITGDQVVHGAGFEFVDAMHIEVLAAAQHRQLAIFGGHFQALKACAGATPRCSCSKWRVHSTEGAGVGALPKGRMARQ